MKEVDAASLLKFKEKTQLEVKQQKKQEFKYIYQGTIVPNRGHTLYEICLKTLDVTEAKYHVQDYVFNWYWKKGDIINSESKVVMREGFAYVSALNIENAIKKFKKNCNGSKFDPAKSYLSI
jgi:hypothetical protein